MNQLSAPYKQTSFVTLGDLAGWYFESVEDTPSKFPEQVFFDALKNHFTLYKCDNPDKAQPDIPPFNTNKYKVYDGFGVQLDGQAGEGQCPGNDRCMAAVALSEKELCQSKDQLKKEVKGTIFIYSDHNSHGQTYSDPDANMRYGANACDWIKDKNAQPQYGNWNLNQISCGDGPWLHDCMKNGPNVAALQLRIPDGIEAFTYSAGGDWSTMFDDQWWHFQYSIKGPAWADLHPKTKQIAGFQLKVMDGWYCPE